MRALRGGAGAGVLWSQQLGLRGARLPSGGQCTIISAVRLRRRLGSDGRLSKSQRRALQGGIARVVGGARAGISLVLLLLLWGGRRHGRVVGQRLAAHSSIGLIFLGGGSEGGASGRREEGEREKKAEGHGLGGACLLIAGRKCELAVAVNSASRRRSAMCFITAQPDTCPRVAPPHCCLHHRVTFFSLLHTPCEESQTLISCDLRNPTAINAAVALFMPAKPGGLVSAPSTARSS